MSGKLDCTDVGKLVENNGGGTWGKFQLVYRLTIWELGCLSQIKNSQERGLYPREQEEKLFNDIKREIINIKPDLIRLDVKNLKYIGVILQDYRVGGDVEFNKFLVSSLLESYGSIAGNVKLKLRQKPKGDPKDEPPWKSEWRGTIQDLEKDGQIEQYFGPKPNPMKETNAIDPKVEKYLNLRKDVDSLYTIISKFDELKQQSERSTKEFDLALQRLFHVAGEYVKDTQMSPNLSGKIRESLMDLGVPVKQLSDFRDMLAHHQLFPLIELDIEGIERILKNDFLPIKKIMENKISEMEESYIRSIIEEKLSKTTANSELKPVLEKFLEESKKGVGELLKSIKNSKSMSSDVAELYQNVLRMKSKDFLVEERQLPETKLGSSISDFIIESKLKMYGRLREELESWKNKYNIDVGSLLEKHEYVLEMIKVMDHLSYGTSSISKETLDNFIRAREFENGVVKDEDSVSTLKKELKKYLDSEAFSQNLDWSIPKDTKLEDVTKLLGRKSETVDGKEVLNFLKRLYGEGSTISLTADEYRQLVENLGVEKSIKEKLLSFSKTENPVLSWNIPEGTRLEDFVDLLKGIKESGPKNKLINFFNSLIESTHSLSPREYKSLVDNLKLSKADTATLHSFSVDWKKKECARLLKKHYSSDLKNVYDAIIQGDMKLVASEYKDLIPYISPHVKELYDSRVREEINVLGQLKNPNAVESQIVNIYSLLDNAQEKSKKNDGTADRTAGIVEGKEDIKKFRNYLSHGDALTNTDENIELAKQVVELKDSVVTKLREIIGSNDKNIDIPKIEGILDGVELSKGILKIKGILCPRNSRTARNINGCLTWEDIEKVVDGKMKTVDPDIIKIDSEKLMSVLSKEMNEEKFYNYIALAGESKVEGVLKNEVDGLITHHETYIKHLEKVGKFSGAVMHGMIAKDIFGDILRGDYKGVAIDLGFFGGSIGLGKVAEIAALKGAGFVAKGSVFLGRSLQLASPFLARGVSAFVAYDLWSQVEELKGGNKDAIVSIVGDSIQLGVDAVVLGIEIAEGLSLIGGISAAAGPIGMAIGVTIFVGVEVFKAVRAVEKINERIHLTGWERFVQGLGAFVGLNPSKYLQDLMEEKDGNNAAVQYAIKVLKENPHIQRYVFPSYIQVDGKVVSALNSVVQLSEKMYNIKWTRSRPDDVGGINLFCKPKGDWESAPGTGTYICENAIGVEYLTNRTGNNTLINLGKGDDWVAGFRDSGNIFIIDESHKTMFGGSKDDNFIFEKNDEFDNKITGSIDGLGGLDTVDVGGLPSSKENVASSTRRGTYSSEELIADFSVNSLKFGNNVMVSMNNINKFQGMPRSRDRVIVACDTSYVDGRGGSEDSLAQDEIIIPDDKTCNYKTTIVVRSNTCVFNYANQGELKYFINGDQGKRACINLSASSTAKNTLIFKYSIEDTAAINRLEKNTIKFSFANKFYETHTNPQLSNSFNLTVSGGVEDNIYLLSDNTRIVVGKNKLYAVQNTDKPINSIVREYTDIMNKLHMIAVVLSNNEVLTIGGHYNDVISNDPSADRNHFVSGAGENIFSFTSGRETLTRNNLPINDTIVHYLSAENSIDTLDLRKIMEQVENDLDTVMKVSIKKHGDDLTVNLCIDDENERISLMEITLEDVILFHWYHKIRLVLETPFVIREHEGEFRLVPEPLIFNDKRVTLYVITPRDVVEGMRIKVAKELRSYHFVRDDDALIITNSLSSDAYKYPLATIILNDFYNTTFRGTMESLDIEFDDKKFSLSQETEKINGAQDFDEMRQNVKVRTYRAVVAAMNRTQELFEAIDQGELQLAKDIIDNDDDIVSTMDGWMNPLVYAATKGQMEVVKYLVDKGADVTVKDSSGHSPVYHALKNQHEKVATVLLSALYSEGDKGMIAATGELTVVEFIVKLLNECHDCFSEATSEHLRNSLMHYAAINGNLDVVKYLIEEGLEDGLYSSYRAKDGNGHTPLYYAVKYRHAGVVEYLDKSIRNSKGEGMTLLCFAAHIGCLDIVKYLIDEREADIYEKDKSSHTPMYYALENGDEDVIGYISKTIVREGEGQLLSYAVITEDISTMRQFIERGVPVSSKNDHGKTPLHYAAIRCNLDMVKSLIDANADVYAKDSSGHTPLYYALIEGLRGRVRIDASCESLLPHLTKNWDILLFAAKAGELQIVQNLYRETKDHVTQQTLLHLAVLSQNLELIEFLIQVQGLSPNAIDADGQTPLHYAVKIDNFSIVKYLDEQGADFNIRDKNGRTPLDLAAYQVDIDYYYDDEYSEDYYEEEYYEEEYYEEEYCEEENYEDQDFVGDYFEEKYARIRRDVGGNSHQIRLDPTGGGNASHESNAPGIQQSSGVHNGIVSWVKNSFSGVLNSASNEKTSISQIGSQIDVNGTMMLLDLLVRKATGHKHVSTVDHVESPLEIQGYALNVVELFESVLNKTALDLSTSLTRLNFDPLAMQSAVIRYRRYGKTSDIPTMMLSFAKKACPDLKQTDKFLEQFRINLERDLEDKTELLLPKIDLIPNPIFSSKYGVVMRVVEADVVRIVGNDPVALPNGTSEVLKIDNVEN